LSKKTFQIAPHMSLNKKIGGQFERSPLGLQKSNQKEREVDPFAQLGSPGKKIKSGQCLDPYTILEKEGLNHQAVGSL